MSDDLLGVLTRFHREVVIPDLERIVDSKLDTRLSPFRREMLANFDAVFKRFDRLESEYQAVTAAVHRVEERVASLETAVQRMALRSELVELRERVHVLEQRLAELEAEL